MTKPAERWLVLAVAAAVAVAASALLPFPVSLAVLAGYVLHWVQEFGVRRYRALQTGQAVR